MKFTLSWLKTHLDTAASLTEIAETLTRIGLEVEGLENAAETLGGFRIARIVMADQHPNADRLRVCQVDVGEAAPLQVVCGAPNARAGLKTVFAAPGTYIPAKNFTIAKGVIRGVESGGMMCSPEELGLEGDSSGIFELPEDAPVGAAYATYAGLDDPLIEINLTPTAQTRPASTALPATSRRRASAVSRANRPRRSPAASPAP